MYTPAYATISTSTKGGRVVALLLESNEGVTRKDLASSIGCTVARVGEVVRALGSAVATVGGVVTIVDHDLLPLLSERSVGVKVVDEEVAA